MPLTIPIRLPGRKTPASGSAPVASVSERGILISDLLAELEKYLAPDEVGAIHDAYLFGAQAHEGQTRRSGEPYIYHPLSVARILADMRLDSRSLIAAILHDTVEDTGVSHDDIANRYGEDVADLVDGVTKIGQIEFESKEQAEAENFRKMLLAMARDLRVILIKLADRLHNMRTLGSLGKTKRERIAGQTLDIYAPIARRLGLYQWAQELEDLSFMNLYPKRYNAITRELKKIKGSRNASLQKVCDNIAAELEKENIPAKVTGREKNVYSVYRKMKEKRQQLSNLADIFAIRVVVDSVGDCYRALGMVHGLYKPVPGRFKDYIAIPKVNGYQSLHTQVFGTFGQSVEVQIRTEEMHRVSESGVASHWLYKNTEDNGDAPRQLARRWLVDLLDTQEKANNASEFLEHLKTDLYPDEIYVFTPRGDIRKLPKGATALDFAYAVHSDIGNHCIGAKVDHLAVPLNHELTTGNRVEILTSRKAHPTPSWLNYVVTGKARAAIRTQLKSRERNDAIRLGKQLLNRALKGLGLARRLRSERKVDLLGRLGLEDWNDLLFDMGTGHRLPMVVARQLYPEGEVEGQGTPDSLPIKGVEGMMIQYARCCRPIPGDHIVGFLTKGRGIVIHTNKCPNTAEYSKRPENWLQVHWAEQVRGTFPVDLRIETVNKPGVLAGVAASIAEQDANINDVAVASRDGRHSVINFTVEVRDRKHLADIMRTLHNLKHVLRVTRKRG